MKVRKREYEAKYCPADGEGKKKYERQQKKRVRENVERFIKEELDSRSD